jgi:hypothetical protein
MAHTALRSVGDAIEATRSFLLPASPGRIAKLALVALFLGAPGTPLPANPQFADPRYWQFPDTSVPEEGDVGGASLPDGVALAEPWGWPTWLLAAVGIALALLFAYVLLGVVMRFVFVEALRSDAVRMRRDGRRHLRDALGVVGLRVVVWSLALPLPAIAALSGAGVGPLAGADLGIAVVGAAAFVAVVLAWAIEVLTLQFVVPTMIAGDRGVLAGWRRFWRTLRGQPFEYGLYGAVRVALGVAVGIAAALAVALVLALVAIVLGTIAAIVVVLAGGVGSLGAPSIAVLGLLLTTFLLVGLATAAAVAVPFQCYLWIYALLVLGDTDPDLDLIPELRAATRSGGPSPA